MLVEVWLARATWAVRRKLNRGSLSTISALSDQLYEHLLDVLTHVPGWLVLFIREFSPNLNSEHAFVLTLALVQKSHSAEFVGFFKLWSHRLENKFFPDFLCDWDWSAEINTVLATLWVNLVFPLRLNLKFKQWQTIDPFFFTVDLIKLDRFRFIVVEEASDVFVVQIDPCLSETYGIIKPCNFADRFFIVSIVVMLVETPLWSQLKLWVKNLCELYSWNCMFIRCDRCGLGIVKKHIPSFGWCAGSIDVAI